MTGVTHPEVTDPTVHTRLTVGGMHCGNCVRHVQEALAELPGVSAEVDLDAALATVTHPASVPVQQLLDTVGEAGYAVAVSENAGR